MAAKKPAATTSGAHTLEAALNRAAQLGLNTADQFLTRDAVCRVGIWAVDYLLLGTGGIPCGRMVEVFGIEHAGKTSLCLSAVREAQRMYPDKLVAYFDVEGSLRDRRGVQWIKAFGIDTSRLIMPEVYQLEPVYDYIYKMVTEFAGDYSLIVFDSLAQSSPQKMMQAKEAGFGTQPLREFGNKRAVAEESGANTEFVKAVTVPAMDSQTTIIVVNQLRDLLALNKATKADMTVTPGGRAIKYTYSARLRMERMGDIAIGSKDDRRVVGSRVGIRVTKSKFGPSFRETGRDTGDHLNFVPNVIRSPWDPDPDIIWAAQNFGLVTKAGSWYTNELHNIRAQGLDAFAAKLKEIPAVWNQLREACEAAALANNQADGQLVTDDIEDIEDTTSDSEMYQDDIEDM